MKILDMFILEEDEQINELRDVDYIIYGADQSKDNYKVRFLDGTWLEVNDRVIINYLDDNTIEPEINQDKLDAFNLAEDMLLVIEFLVTNQDNVLTQESIELVEEAIQDWHSRMG